MKTTADNKQSALDTPEPVGTNLFEYTQAKAMVEHMLEGLLDLTAEVERLTKERDANARDGYLCGQKLADAEARAEAAEAKLRESVPDDTHTFKNFHRSLCDRFGYTHDEKDWRRDQVSLIEWISRRATPPSAPTATISKCGKYRYRLDRRVAETGPVYAFFGVNPSTADASIDDATVRKWRGFVSRWGGSRFIVGNVFAFRATDVRDLAGASDPIGRLSNDYIGAIISEADILVPCWGNETKVPRDLRSSFRWLRQQLEVSGKQVKAFGYTKSGDPLHPLMLGYDTRLVDWKVRP